MAEQVTDDWHKSIDEKLQELKRQLRQKEGYPYSLMKLSVGLQELIEGRFCDSPELLSYLFSSHKKQIRNLRRWNKEHGWGFTEKDLDRATSQISELSPEIGLQRWTLTAFPAFPYEVNDYLKIIIESQCGQCDVSDMPPSLNQGTIRLSEGIEYPGKCLKWVLIDLDETGCEIPREQALHIQGLAAIAQHPNWIRATYSDVGAYAIPPLSLSGFQINISWADKFEDYWTSNFEAFFDPSRYQICFLVLDEGSCYTIDDGELGGYGFPPGGQVVRELPA